MKLSFKENLDEALQRWEALWNKEIIRRPCVAVTAPKDGVKPVPGPSYPHRPDSDFDSILEQAEASLGSRYWGGEAMPFFEPSFGPDQLAAFVGAELGYSDDSNGTSWSIPFIESWDDVLPLKLGEGNSSWNKIIEFYKRAREKSEGKFLLGMLDLHSNLDWLAAVRSPDKLCMDLLDVPDKVHNAMTNVRKLYREVYVEVYEAGGMAGRGTCGWLPYFSPERYATTQCDFACLLSPDQFNEFVLPALEEECNFLDRSVYHYDGAVALQHFDAVTGIRKLDGIQWTPGAGAKPMIEWIDLLKKFQNTGKNVFVGCSAEEVKIFHRELKPNLVLYSVSVSSQKEAENLLKWLERNT
jgi:hypothetical protein